MVVNTDAEKMLLCIKKDHHTEDEWIALHNHSKSFIDKKEALQYLSKDVVPGSRGANILITALDDAFWGLRQYAINNIRPFAESDDKEKVRSKLIYIIQNDKVATVRNTALKSLIKYFPSEGDSTILRMAIKWISTVLR